MMGGHKGKALADVCGLLGRIHGDQRSDAELLAQFSQSRDETAFRELLRRHGNLAWGVCLRVLGHQQDAEDAFQATFLALARRASSVRKPQSVASWLYRAAYHLSMQLRRVQARRRAREGRAAEATQRARDMGEGVNHKRGLAADPLEAAGWEETVTLLDEELSRLPDIYRSPVVLCDLEGRSHTEAARLLGWPVGTLKTRLQRARELLRSRLVRRGLTLSAGALTGLVAATATRGAPPAALTEATFTGAVSFAAGGAAGAASAQAVRLARGMVYAGLLGKLKTALVGLLVLGLVGSGASALLAPPAAAQARPAEPAAALEPAPDARGDAFGDPLPPGALARLGTVRWRNGPGLSQFTFDPSSDRVVTAGSDGVLRVWDTRSGRLVSRRGKPLPPHRPCNLALSANGRRAAVVGFEPTIRVVDVDTGAVLRQFDPGRPRYGRELALSCDGTMLAMREGHRLIVWDVGPGRELCRATTQGFQDIVQVNVRSRSLSVSMNSSSSLAFSPDGRALAVCFRDSHYGVQVFDLPSGKERWRVADRTSHFRDAVQRAAAPAFAADGKVLARLAPDGSVRLHETESGRELRRLAPKSPDDPAVRCALSPDGNLVAVTTAREAVWLYDLAAGKERVVQAAVATYDRTGFRGFIPPPPLAFSPDGKTLARRWGPNGLRLWDVATGRPRADLGTGHVGSVQWVTVSADGKAVLTRGSDETARQWDLTDGRQRGRFTVPADALGSALSADGRTLAVLDEGAIVLQDLATDKQLHRLRLPDLPFPPGLGVFTLPGGTFSPDGRRLAAHGFDQKLRVWDVAAGKELAVLAGGIPGVPADEDSMCVTAYAWTPGGTQLASLTLNASAVYRATLVMGDALGTAFTMGAGAANARSVLRVWDVASGRMVRQWQPPGPPLALAFAPEGRTTAVATMQGLYLWEKASNQPRWRHKAVAAAVVFSPDGRLLAVAEGDVVRVRDVRDGRELAHFAGHQAPVRTLAFTPDGRRLVSGSADSTALVWDMAGLRPAAPTPGPAASVRAIEALWEDLRQTDAPRAYAAVLALGGAADQSVPWMRQHLRPAVDPEAKRVERLLADLDAEAFAARERATRELAAMGRMVRPALEKALQRNPSPEKRRRVQTLLLALEPGPTPLAAEDLRQARAVEALETAATAEARRLLHDLASGAPSARLTHEAQAALQRLAGHTAAAP
jgi:RNA polymerase sigma factor (sigma-70 family)